MEIRYSLNDWPILSYRLKPNMIGPKTFYVDTRPVSKNDKNLKQVTIFIKCLTKKKSRLQRGISAHNHVKIHQIVYIKKC
jgi:hypothetical protein